MLTGARVFPLDAIAGGADEVTPGVHLKAVSAGVSAVWDEVKNVATHLAAVSSSRPASVGEALDRVPPHQSKPSIAAHLTASAQRAHVGSASGGVTGDLSIGQTRSMTPVWIFVVKLRSVVFFYKVSVGVINYGP